MKKIQIKILKARLIEAIKYDFNALKFPLVLAACLLIWALILLGKHLKAFNLVSAIYRTGWAGSYRLGVYFAKYYFSNPNKYQTLTAKAIAELEPLPNTAQFFDHPERMLDGIITVLKSPKDNEKGVIILNYSYYFLMFHKYFEANKIFDEYIIVLEPSWAGFCELSILSYANIKHPVYLMCYEKRDLNFINALNSSLKPLEIGPSWFVNHTNFQPMEVPRDIDIIMVAAWADFKRHGAFFKAISKMKQLNYIPKITLVGYSVDLEQDFIRQEAEYYGIADWITFHQSITHPEVCQLLNRSKVNVLWSKFEGNNRAIIEGMFCNTIVIMREGHNYDEHYDFINEQTGCFANEENLAKKVLAALQNYAEFKPREYVMNKRSCILATEIMNNQIARDEQQQGRNWTTDMEIKVNELHQMDYLDLTVREQFKTDYQFLLKNMTKSNT